MRRLVVDHDVAARVAAHAGPVEAQIVGVGPAADRQQQVRADDLGLALGAVDADDDVVAALGEADALGIQPDRDPLALEDRLTAADTSSSSCWISRGAISMTVTSLPKRR